MSLDRKDTIHSELVNEEAHTRLSMKRYALLELFVSGVKRNEQPPQKVLRRFIQTSGLRQLFPVSIETKKLEGLYKKHCSKLTAKYPDAMIKTPSECRMASVLKDETNLKFYRSMWIGCRNIDLFFPQIAGDSSNKKTNLRHHGLAIEIDGDIHNRTFKLLKDQSKQKALHRYGIALSTIENDDAYNTRIRNFARQLSKLETLDSRARERVLRRIYCATLAFTMDDREIAELLNISLNKLVQLERTVK